MHASDQYIVVVSKERFVLSKAQVEFDAPNYFTRYFLNRKTVEPLELSRDPNLFRIITEYLCGYSSFLSDASTIRLPGTRTHADLLRDASFYELTNLERRLADLTEQPGTGGAKSDKLLVLIWTAPIPKYQALERVTALGSERDGVSSCHIYVNRDMISKMELGDIRTPELCSNLKEFKELSAAQQQAKSVLQTPDAPWRVEGWSIVKQNTSYGEQYQVSLVLLV